MKVLLGVNSINKLGVYFLQLQSAHVKVTLVQTEYRCKYKLEASNGNF